MHRVFVEALVFRLVLALDAARAHLVRRAVAGVDHVGKEGFGRLRGLGARLGPDARPALLVVPLALELSRARGFVGVVALARSLAAGRARERCVAREWGTASSRRCRRRRLGRRRKSPRLGVRRRAELGKHMSTTAVLMRHQVTISGASTYLNPPGRWRPGRLSWTCPGGSQRASMYIWPMGWRGDMTSTRERVLPPNTPVSFRAPSACILGVAVVVYLDPEHGHAETLPPHPLPPSTAKIQIFSSAVAVVVSSTIGWKLRNDLPPHQSGPAVAPDTGVTRRVESAAQTARAQPG